MTEGSSTQQRQLTRDDFLPPAEYQPVRRERRRRLSEVKRQRQVEIGPIAIIHFENLETVRHQIQEMLYIEKGGDAQLKEELEAYGPLIPQGTELVATVMFEIDDPVRRDLALRALGGVDQHFFLEIGAERVTGRPDGEVERTRDDGKTSAVHFLRFPMTNAQAAAFKAGAAALRVGCDHPGYGHLAVIGEASRAELARDLD